MAGSQSDFVRNHINIIPAPVKDIFEKSSDEVPDRTAMKLYRCLLYTSGITNIEIAKRKSVFYNFTFSLVEYANENTSCWGIINLYGGTGFGHIRLDVYKRQV